MRKKRWIAAVAAGTLVLSMTACSGQKKENTDEGEKTLNVGTQANYIGAPAYYAMEKGYFEDAGLDVNLIIFDSGAPVNEALAAGEIDVGQSGFASIYSMTSGVCSWVMEIDNELAKIIESAYPTSTKVAEIKSLYELKEHNLLNHLSNSFSELIDQVRKGE